MIRDLNNGKCSCGSFAVTSGAVTSINIPDDSVGVKMYSSSDYFFNVNDNPQSQVANTLVTGGFGVGGVVETRNLQIGVGRTLKLSASNDCNVLVEFWG